MAVVGVEEYRRPPPLLGVLQGPLQQLPDRGQVDQGVVQVLYEEVREALEKHGSGLLPRSSLLPPGLRGRGRRGLTLARPCVDGPVLDREDEPRVEEEALVVEADRQEEEALPPHTRRGTFGSSPEVRRGGWAGRRVGRGRDPEPVGGRDRPAHRVDVGPAGVAPGGGGRRRARTPRKTTTSGRPTTGVCRMSLPTGGSRRGGPSGATCGHTVGVGVGARVGPSSVQPLVGGRRAPDPRVRRERSKTHVVPGTVVVVPTVCVGRPLLCEDEKRAGTGWGTARR